MAIRFVVAYLALQCFADIQARATAETSVAPADIQQAASKHFLHHGEAQSPAAAEPPVAADNVIDTAAEPNPEPRLLYDKPVGIPWDTWNRMHSNCRRALSGCDDWHYNGIGTSTWSCYCGARDTCLHARDGECDEGTRWCDYGTDCSDCGTCPTPSPTPRPTPRPTPSLTPSGARDTCLHARDGECDEGYACEYGTDCSDCGTCGARDTCTFARDGECDEGTHLCEYGTDCSDCGTCPTAAGLAVGVIAAICVSACLVQACICGGIVSASNSIKQQGQQPVLGIASILIAGVGCCCFGCIGALAALCFPVDQPPVVVVAQQPVILGTYPEPDWPKEEP